MGPVRKIMMARAKDPLWRKKAQTGGVVSALIDFALREGVIQAGILTPRDGDLLPQGKIITEPQRNPQLCRFKLCVRSYSGGIE